MHPLPEMAAVAIIPFIVRWGWMAGRRCFGRRLAHVGGVGEFLVEGSGNTAEVLIQPIKGSARLSIISKS
jgi:hypothetical protein